jgi:hypothetical protein
MNDYYPKVSVAELAVSLQRHRSSGYKTLGRKGGHGNRSVICRIFLIGTLAGTKGAVASSTQEIWRLWSAFNCQHCHCCKHCDETCSPFKDSDSFIPDFQRRLILSEFSRTGCGQSACLIRWIIKSSGKTQKDLSALINKASYSKLSSHLGKEDLIVLQTAGEPATALWMEPTYGAISPEDSERVSSFLTDKEY